MTEAIIFDKDGTLFDFGRTWGGWAERLLDELAGEDTDLRARASEAIRYDRMTGFHPSSIVIAGTSGEVGATLAAATGREASMIERLANDVGAVTPQSEVPGLVETLKELSKRHVLGVVTNDGEAPARSHLDSVGILGLFSFVAGYDSGHGAKPAPGPLLAFSKATGTSPDRTLMVGDSRHDLAAGRGAGMTTVGVLTGLAEALDLGDLADVILPDITHLPEWILAQG